MTRQFVPWTEWECYRNGMWRLCSKEETNEMLPTAIEFTSGHRRYGSAMIDVIDAWPNSMLHFLTNTGMNRRAYLGHSAVTSATGIPESVTRAAWAYLTEEQQALANAEAKTAIELYEHEIENRGIRAVVGKPLLPGWIAGRSSNRDTRPCAVLEADSISHIEQRPRVEVAGIYAAKVAIL